MSEKRVLIVKWDEEKESLEESVPAEKETRFIYGNDDMILLVIVKDPGRVPRVMPVNIEDPGLFISEDFEETWEDIGNKVRVEISRIGLK